MRTATRRRPALVLACALTASFVSMAYAQPTFQGLGFLTTDSRGPCLANAVSADGSTVVGMSNSDTGLQAFRWTQATGIVGLGAFANPGFTSSQARAVSANGSVIVGSSVRPNSLNEDGSPFIWTQATGLVFLGSLGGTEGGVARGVSADGSVVVGYGSDSNFNLEAFRWTSSTGPLALGDVAGGPINSQAAGISGDGSRIVGIGSHSFVYDTGFSWTAGGGIVPFTGGFQPLGVSQNGQVVVGRGVGRAVVVSPGGSQTLPHLGGNGTTDTAYAASADGSVVVGLMALDQNNGDFGHAFIWDAQNGMRLFEDILSNDPDIAGWFLNAATGISADGLTICGYGFDPTGEQAGWVVRFPPASQCGSADFNCDGDIGTDADIESFFACLAGTCPAAPCANSADFNGDGDIGTDTDIEAFFRVLAGSPC